MNKHVITALILLGTFVSNPSLTNAQGVQDVPNNQAPTNDNPGQTGGTTDNRNDGLNWWWILPLLAIPLLFLLRRNNKEEDTSTYRSQSMAGSKGGEATRNRDDDI